jgi:hypothetical protein
VATISQYSALSWPGRRLEALSLPCRGSAKVAIAAPAIDPHIRDSQKGWGQQTLFRHKPKTRLTWEVLVESRHALRELLSPGRYELCCPGLHSADLGPGYT